MTATHNMALRLAALLDLDAKIAAPEDNPLATHTLEQIAHGAGVAKAADHFPAQSMAPKGAIGYEMEAARLQARADGKVDRSAHRMAAARRRAQRKIEFDAIAKSEVRPSDERLNQAWYVVFPLVPIVARAANAKKAWASRLLGANVDDIAQMSLMSMAEVLAKSDRDLTVLRTAAEQLAEVEKRTGKMPGDQRKAPVDKDVRRARKWLMGMVNNRVLGALVDSYMSPENVRWDNIDRIATVIATINGPDSDPMTARFKADRAPAFLGTKFQRPGGIDSALLATAINAAISDRGLDRMAEILLDLDNRRSNGSMAWSKNAEAIFLATPTECGSGEALWQAVEQVTAHLARPSRARADAARLHARNLFEWLPGLIVDVVNTFDFEAVAHIDGAYAVMASEFEVNYLHRDVSPMGERRYPLAPALQYTTVEEAAGALAENLSNLLSGNDVVRELVNA